MTEELKKLGTTIANLRVSRGLQQSELAYEAGVSERTLQRLEAGNVVKADGLVKLLVYLKVFEDVLNVLKAPQISPVNLARESQKRKATAPKKRRVRTKKVAGSISENEKTYNVNETKGEWVWPEDRK